MIDLVGTGLVIAQDAPPPAAPGWLMLWYIAPLILIFWFLILRPQKKEKERRKRMLDELKKNDRVITIGGVHGTVKKVEDNDVILAVDDDTRDKVRIRISKSAVHDLEGPQSRTDEPSSPPEPAS
ncbi:MAG: preprotein translocase subunit YajC [Planctomycetota bacterium]